MKVISKFKNYTPDVIEFATRERAVEYIAEECNRLMAEIKEGWKIDYKETECNLYKENELVLTLKLDNNE